MLYPSVNDILKKVDSRYTLVLLVSKRARQLVEGSDPFVDVNSTKPVSIALHEVAEDKVTYTRPDMTSIK
ncbi:DNA-directed RNA polymerase subunit omega [Clostridium sp. D2Q-11]|uniref:DNA-directed RNA polymerase subunit omega n=1 Tax=Anaeromonas frigoriresistens TaxID=2683708 RepID=A0A942V4G9_9FIRM|nr:DNA-directed RNA polymerase subunit omega [Anaeromonas frigoriresistens]MBS4539732.1 DNA-directed RNA polymerase subunit omega [Anaeromonas frigoriresistens]